MPAFEELIRRYGLRRFDPETRRDLTLRQDGKITFLGGVFVVCCHERSEADSITCIQAGYSATLLTVLQAYERQDWRQVCDGQIMFYVSTSIERAQWMQVASEIAEHCVIKTAIRPDFRAS